MKIVVNGIVKHVNSVTGHHHLDYAEIVRLADKDPARVYTVTYCHEDHQGGIFPGNDITACEGMIFNVAHTGGA